jgi:hypothetical protein
MAFEVELTGIHVIKRNGSPFVDTVRFAVSTPAEGYINPLPTAAGETPTADKTPPYPQINPFETTFSFDVEWWKDVLPYYEDYPYHATPHAIYVWMWADRLWVPGLNDTLDWFGDGFPFEEAVAGLPTNALMDGVERSPMVVASTPNSFNWNWHPEMIFPEDVTPWRFHLRPRVLYPYTTGPEEVGGEGPPADPAHGRPESGAVITDLGWPMFYGVEVAFDPSWFAGGGISDEGFLDLLGPIGVARTTMGRWPRERVAAEPEV